MLSPTLLKVRPFPRRPTASRILSALPADLVLPHTGRVARGRLRPGDEDHAVNSPWLTYSTPEVYIVTPATHVTWKVDFPAGKLERDNQSSGTRS